MATTYNSHIVTDGLVLCLDAANPRSYPLSGNTWYDLSGNDESVDGTDGNVDSTNFLNGYCTFDGSDEYLLNSTFTPNTSSFSVEAWAYPTSSSVDSTVVGQWDTTGGYILYLDFDDGALGFDFVARVSNASNIKRTGTTDNNASINQWHHLVGSFNTTEMKLYVNTSLRNTVSTGGSLYLSSTQGFCVGVDASTIIQRYFNGNISMIRFYNRVLSADEVRRNYNATRGRYGI